MILSVSLVDGGVITEDVLLREVGRDLRERLIEIADSARDISLASGLCREGLHPPFGGEIAHISVVIKAGLHDVNLAFICRQTLQGGVEIVVLATGRVATV